MNNDFFHKKDIIILLIIIAISVVIYFAYTNFIMKNANKAEIYYDNKLIQKVDLSKNATFSPDGFPDIVFQVKDNSIAFIHSDCPDKICVNTGFINMSGQTAVCLPNKMMIKLDTGDNDVDTVT